MTLRFRRCGGDGYDIRWGDPLLAHWQYGLGRVLAYTSEAGQGWGESWYDWRDFGKFWDQAVRWTMGSPASKLFSRA